MKKVESLSYLIVVACIVLHLNGASCNGEDDSVLAPMQKTEQDALFSAIQGFVGKWWNGSDLYPDPCGWTPIQGVSCDVFDGFWYVTELSIGPVHDNSLTCAPNLEFSPHLFALTHLKSLSFFNCFTSPPFSIPPQNWDLLAPTLQSLEFRSNSGLTGTIPLNFGELTNLQSLVLTENGLTGEIPQNLGSLINLRRLNLAGNSLTGRIPDSLGGLNHLLILDMSRNSLSGVLPLTLGGLTSLLKLDLSNNQLEGKIPSEFGNMNKLTLMDLSNNRLSGGLTKSVDQMSSLQELVLSNNPGTGGDITGVEWGNLRGLAALDLSNMSLTGGIPESLAELTWLRFLGLSDNKLTGDVPTKLGGLPNVGAMYIHGNNLTGELRFEEWFYGRMGRRFGAWGNPNLCYYSVGFGSPDNAPIGVKQCQEEVIRYETTTTTTATTTTDDDLRHSDSELGNGNRNRNDSDSGASLGLSSVCGFSGLVLVVEALMVLIFNFWL